MNVLIASTFLPFVRGGDVRIVDDLERALVERGHHVDKVLLPFSPDPASMPEQLTALRLLDISDAGDVMIAIRTPSYVLRHPHKVVWFIHHHRPAYDLWETPYQDLADTPEGLATREPILRADDLGLREAERIFANSHVTANRLRDYNQIEAEVLYPPLGNAEEYGHGDYGEYIFCPSRITPTKRQTLLVEAMAHVRTPVRLVLAGAPDESRHGESLTELVNELGVASRVELRLGWLQEREKRDLFAEALGCAYVPYDEDSYGYVTLEAFQARRPVVTCSDSGGTLELVSDRETGLVVDPDPERLAEAFDELHENRALASRLGEAGAARVEELVISWDRVAERLLA